ncbi:MAG: coproporphyrinogen dehydrogenase HemZ [Clostridia bacterium]|nr:coproporphyrinogen dehydrogenase HemZ [Clostridia bacterium]
METFFKTNCSFLQNELLDVARLFKRRPVSVLHEFRFENGVFYNSFVVDGQSYSFKNEGQVPNELIFKRLERRFAKLAFFKILRVGNNDQMPWGALTGIRPTKLAYTELAEGRAFEPLFEMMFVSEENVRLIERVLKAQEGIYERNDDNFDVFVSLPFCPTKCAYCSFITAPIEKTRSFLPDYLSCLKREIEAGRSLSRTLRSLYIGGGTPFALEASELEQVLKALSSYVVPGVEYTVEAGRPDTFTEEKLRLLKDYGVNRVCINPQTFSDETLKAIGRKHTVAQVYQAFEMMQKYDFTINADLIAGLTGETPETFALGVEKAVATGAENITVHCLSLKSGAKLKEECEYLDNPAVSKMVASAREILTANGYEPYYLYRQKYQVGNNENTGWTKPGKACVYNIDIMEETANNLAFGANGVSKKVENAENKISRFAAPKDLRTYIQKIDEIIAGKEKFFHSNA